ncbi:MAG: PilZ domain-containing protein [Treponema sp.]|jgi:hypothetical protein|nr:PilZ domain-containing protein [Treponema sp.]
MKLLLVLGSDKTYDIISLFFKPMGFQLIRYHHVLKAMDNVDEIDPMGIIISAKDFPRHWKTMVRFVRTERPRNKCSIVILKGENFPEEEANKAKALEVNGLFLESLENSPDLEKIKTLLYRALPAAENKKPFAFVFSHPIDERLITGTVKTITSMGLTFEPDRNGIMDRLNIDIKIMNCSLRAGKEILSPACMLRQAGKIISLEFISFPGAEKETLEQSLLNF